MALFKTKTINLSTTEKAQKAREERIKLFTEVPIWKSIIKMGWPAMLMMFITGLFYFADTVLAINFANDSYHTIDGVDGAHQVRMFTGAYAPIVSVVLAISLLVSMGTSTRVSINLGRKDLERAKSTMRTGTMFSMGLSFILIPVLMFSAHPWMAGQMETSSPNLTGDKIATTAMDFAWIMIGLSPFQFFNQLTGSMFRTEARNKQTMVATIPPILLNILLDWVFMGPMGMGIEGAAWATFIATAVTSLIFIFYIFKDRHHSLITFANMYGKFKLIPIVGIILVGIAPFFRNMSQSITQTVEMHAMTSVGETVYSAHGASSALLLKSTFLGAAPIFNLFFPILFGFAQGAGPIASFNYGAKNYKRVKQTYMWAFIYASSTGLLIWILSSYALGGPLLNALGVHKGLIVTGSTLNDFTKPILDSNGQITGFAQLATPTEVQLPVGHQFVQYITQHGGTFDYYTTALKLVNILMLTSVFFGGAIAGMVLLSSTDRFFLSLIASTLRGIILFFPLVYIFRYVAEQNPGNEYLFWWFFPTIGILNTIIVAGLSWYTIKHMANKEVSIEERVSMVYAWNNARKEFVANYKNAETKDQKRFLSNEYHVASVSRRVSYWSRLKKMPFYAKLLIKHNSFYKTAATKIKIAK